MKIAFLCLAHNNFDYLSALSDYCCSDDDGFFLHLDSAINISNATLFNENTVLIEADKRKRTRWGTFEIVDATLELINRAVRTEKYDRFILISGSDVPLLNKAKLKEVLNEDASFFSSWSEVSIDDKSDKKNSNEFFKRHYYHSVLTNPGEVYGSGNRFRIHLSRLINFLVALVPCNQINTYEKYYKGSQWWCITKEVAEYFCDESTKELKAEFKNMHAPDEKYFLTLALNSNFRKKIILNHGQNSLKQGLHYIDWGIIEQHSKGLQVFDLKDIEIAIKLNCVFARKLDPVKNNDYITYLKTLY